MTSTETVLSARDRYLADNGFTVAGYDAPGSMVKALGISFYRPLTPGARFAIRRHDLHHVVTGYATDPAGEAEISAWELAGGLRGCSLYVRLIVLGACFAGLLTSPRRVVQSYRAARASGAKNLFDFPDYEALLALPVPVLRARLNVPAEGLAPKGQPAASNAPKAAPVTT